MKLIKSPVIKNRMYLLNKDFLFISIKTKGNSGAKKIALLINVISKKRVKKSVKNISFSIFIR
jgi:hypothetical protein